MHAFQNLFALPASLLALLSILPLSFGQTPPSDLQPHEKYFPEHEDHLRRQWQIQQKMQHQRPIGVRKMVGEGEKFYLDYWEFAPESSEDHGMRGRLGETHLQYSNRTSVNLLPPFPLHKGHLGSDATSWFRRSLFERDFQCPAGTNSCSSIGQPNSCCPTGETCISVQNSDLGPVGCCPQGQDCNGDVAGCDSAQGYTSCPGSPNGGCCIPGYTCQDVGCVLTATSIAVTSLQVSTSPVMNIPPSSVTTTASGGVTPAAGPASIQTVTTTVIITPSTSANPTTVVSTVTISPSPTSDATTTTTNPLVQGPLTCATGYQSCPASLGGGCCPTNRACGSPSCPPLSGSPSTTSSAPANAPVRPTSVTASTDSPITTSMTSATDATTVGACPTGFYMCSAYYMGGCCQVDRNCDTTSCPPKPTTPVVSGSSLTVQGGTPATPVGAAATGTCQNGWSTCAASQGGGCCPSGYVCGATSCTATATGQSNTAKEAPSSGMRVHVFGWAFAISGLAAGMGMILL